MNEPTQVTLVGHPLVPIGMGEHLRSVFRAMRAAGVKIAVNDVYKTGGDDPSILRELEGHFVERLSSDINIFCINGDEVETALARLKNTLPPGAYNIIYPLWELSQYPRPWAEQLDRFEEIWTTSKFTYESVRAAVRKPVLHMPLGLEVKLSGFLPRRHFGIPESAFVFLFFFDFTSYLQRKNPFAVLQAFEELCQQLPDGDLCLVIKVKGGKERRNDYEQFQRYADRYRSRVIVIDRLLNDNEVKNLLRCSNSFVSLHRSEGFGLGLISAMFLGKPVVATGYSGNLDFMTEETSCLVRYGLTDVPNGAYPFGEGQVWADPDISHAVALMRRLACDRTYANDLGQSASRHIRVNFSYRARGLHYLDRLQQIQELRQPGVARAQSAALVSTHQAQVSGAGARAERQSPALVNAVSASQSTGKVFGRGSRPSLCAVAGTIGWKLYNSMPSRSRSKFLKLLSIFSGRA